MAQNPVSQWKRGVVAVGARNKGGIDHSKLMGTGFVVDLCDGNPLISTCAHVVLDIFYEYGDADTSDPGSESIAIGIDGETGIQWWGSAKLVAISPPPADYDFNMCRLRTCGGIARSAFGPQSAPQERRLMKSCPACSNESNWLKGSVPSHWAVRPFDDERTDFALLRLEPLPLGPRPSLCALPLGRPVQLMDGDQIVLLGYGQQAGEVQEDMTFTTMRGCMAGRSGDWLKADLRILSGHSGGPALNRDGEVIGWAVKGTAMLGQLRPITLLENAIRRVRQLLPQTDLGAKGVLAGWLPPEERGQLDVNERARCNEGRDEFRRELQTMVEEVRTAKTRAIAVQLLDLQHKKERARLELHQAEQAEILLTQRVVDLRNFDGGSLAQSIAGPSSASPQPINHAVSSSSIASAASTDLSEPLCTMLTLHVDADLQGFNFHDFRASLANKLDSLITPAQIIIDTVDSTARIQLGGSIPSIRVKLEDGYLRYIGPSADAVQDAQDDVSRAIRSSLKTYNCARDAISFPWAKVVASFIVVVQLELPYALLLLHLIRQRDPGLTDLKIVGCFLGAHFSLPSSAQATASQLSKAPGKRLMGSEAQETAKRKRRDPRPPCLIAS